MHCLDITIGLFVMQTTMVNLLFCFSFLYKNTSACYTSYWKKRRNSKFLSACWFEKNNVDRFVGTIYMAYSHMAYIHMAEKTWTKGQFSHGKLTFLHLFKLRGRGTAGLTAGLGRQRTGTELNGRVSDLFWRRGWNWLQNSRHLQMPHPYHCSEVVPCYEVRKCVYFVMVSSAASITRQGKQKRKEALHLGVLGHMWACQPLWVSSSEVITQICSSLMFKGKKKPKP